MGFINFNILQYVEFDFFFTFSFDYFSKFESYFLYSNEYKFEIMITEGEKLHQIQCYGKFLKGMLRLENYTKMLHFNVMFLRLCKDLQNGHRGKRGLQPTSNIPRLRKSFVRKYFSFAFYKIPEKILI